MANYLYNGVELPELPEWDKETYPYAIIQMVSGYAARLSCTTRPLCNKLGGLYSTETTEVMGSVVSLSFGFVCYRKETEGIDWTFFSEVESTSSLYDPDEVIWTNTDILNEDGTVYLAASEPIPVVESVSVKVNGTTYSGIECVRLPLSDGSGYAIYKL